MCPLWPFHIMLFYLMILGPLFLASFGAISAAQQTFTFHPERVDQLRVGETRVVSVKFNKTELGGGEEGVDLFVSDSYIAYVTPKRIVPNDSKGDQGEGSFNVTGNFLGYTEVCAVTKVRGGDNDTVAPTTVKCVPVSVIRKTGLIDRVFTFSVAGLVTSIYVNMGAALDIRTIKECIRRPYGPLIGFFTQFVIMPLLSFGLAKLLIPVAALQLGLFITGCSPGGGASNIWTLALGGNLDLSITMTTISTFSAFVMMPLWILTLGSTIFEEANLTIPYSKLAMFAISLVVPLAIGIGIQLKWPKAAQFLVRMLKPFAVFLIIFIIIFATYTNLYLFQMFTWQILLAGMLLPWLGYILGGGTALLLKQDWRDILAIGIETGVQNTGLAIFALRFSLPQPEADLTTALPVAVAIMTPILPTVLILCHKCMGRGREYPGVKDNNNKTSSKITNNKEPLMQVVTMPIVPQEDAGENETDVVTKYQLALPTHSHPNNNYNKRNPLLMMNNNDVI